MKAVRVLTRMSDDHQRAWQEPLCRNGGFGGICSVQLPWLFQESSAPAPGPARLLLLKGCLLCPSPRISAVTQSTATVPNLKIPGTEVPGRILDDVLMSSGGTGQVSAHHRILIACVCKLPPQPVAFFLTIPVVFFILQISFPFSPNPPLSLSIGLSSPLFFRVVRVIRIFQLTLAAGCSMSFFHSSHEGQGVLLEKISHTNLNLGLLK